jgi:transcriptional regulator of aromatic amino acid metabolism
MSARQDRTAKSQTEKELIRLASFLELNPNPVVEIDKRGKVTYANPAAKKLFPDIESHLTEHPFLVDLQSVIDIFTSGKKKRRSHPRNSRG